jgi:glycosyltransferase involved in cell wall biosynthesis
MRGLFRPAACRYMRTTPTPPDARESAPDGVDLVLAGKAGLSKPLISVIVPAYNAEATLRECVESILHQSFDDFEVIIVNDGSTDSTSKLAAEIASEDRRVQVVDQDNLGVSAARNRGLQTARGYYVCVLDADDIWVPDKLDSQLAALGQEQDLVVIGGLRRFADNENGRQWLTETMPPDVDEQSDCLATVMHLPSASMNLIGTMLAPRKYLLEIRGWNDRLKTGEDWDVWLQLCSRVRFKALKKTLSYYRKHEASATRKHDVMWVLGQHFSILDGCVDHRNPVDRKTVNSAKLTRLLESAGNLIYDHRLGDAAKVLLRSAGYGCVWGTHQFYVRVKELAVQSLRDLAEK